ncbi:MULTISPECIES: hypothetical protein [unclassified Streptomyces]|uniref:hypothetical protein n=1 Tax=unclassified Streptomyces TaxID=2593676 RepID=UPI0033B1E666
MIPHGLTPANDERAAQIFGVALKTWQGKRRWESVPGLKLLNREGAARRLYAEEHLQAARTNADLQAAGKPLLPMPPTPAAGHDLDLLDLEEARLSLPEDRRVTDKTWKSYAAGTKTNLPDPDHTDAGTNLWYRKTIRDWDANRLRKGAERPDGQKWPGGRPPGSKDSRPKQYGPETLAGRRRARTAELLAAQGKDLTPEQVEQDLGISLRQAERLLLKAREHAAEQLLAERGDLDPAEARTEVGLYPRSEAERRITQTDALLKEKGAALTAPEAAAALGIGMRQANEALRQVRLDRIRAQRAEKGRVTARWICDTFGVRADVADRLLEDSRTGTTAVRG